jgi:putative ATP-dependent endonuclease of the OLD family
MIISKIEVKNFRSLRESKLDSTYLTAILGRNGAGKSTILHALSYFYNISAPITEEDFFDRDTNSTIEIRVTYDSLNENEVSEFDTYTHGDKLTVTKRINFNGGKPTQKYYAAALQIPDFATIRSTSGKRDQVSAWNGLIGQNTLPDLSTTVKKADDIFPIMNEYERQHQDLCELVEREEQFFGPASIGGGKLDKFTRFVLIPAVKDVIDETAGKKGAIFQLIDLIVLRKVNARKDIQEFKKEFEEKVKQLYSADNLTELKLLGVSLTEILQKFSPGSKLNLAWSDVQPPEINLPSPLATLVEDDFEGDISRKGHGLQRALVLTLLQQLAMTDKVEKSDVEEVQQNDTSPDLILAIEEPELFLHPSRCRYLSSLLIQLTRNDVIGENKNQILFATHSPYFIELHRFDQIRCVRKIESPDSQTKQSLITSFTLQEAATELARITESEPSKFTAESFTVRALPVMNIIVNEGFFADKVIVVEGNTELGVFWKLQEIMNKRWEEMGIVIVPANGKNNIDRPVVIFRGLGIPTYFVFDGDAKYADDKDKKDATIKRNKIYMNLANHPVADFPDSKADDNFAVFHDNIEKEIETGIGSDNFIKIRDELACNLGYDKPSTLLKNIYGASNFISRIYDLGLKVEILENVIEKVTELQ